MVYTVDGTARPGLVNLFTGATDTVGKGNGSEGANPLVENKID